MDGTRSLLVSLAVLSALTGTGMQHATAMPAPAVAYAVSAEADDPETTNEPYLLFAEISRRPDRFLLTADGTPDFSGALFTVTALNAQQQEYDIVRDATLETVKAHLQVEMETEPMDPEGLLCKLTFSAYNVKTQQTVSDSMTIPFAPAPQTTTAVTTATTAKVTTTASAVTTVTTVTSTTATTQRTVSVPETTAGTAATTATTQTTTTTTQESPYLLGDCNADERFTIADVVLTCKWLVRAESTIPAWRAADMDGNAVLNAADLTLMKRMLLGQLVYPVANPVVIDGFTPSTATLADSFSDWRFHVIIKHQYSVPERVWTADDFKSVAGIKRIEMYDQRDPYRQIVQIALQEPSRETVLQMIQSIEALHLEEVKEVQVVQDAFGG